MEQTLTLREAGIRLGVTGKALKRLIRAGVLPEAKKIKRPEGRTWAIPADSLATIAQRQGWVIDLTQDEPVLDTVSATPDGEEEERSSDSNLTMVKVVAGKDSDETDTTDSDPDQKASGAHVYNLDHQRHVRTDPTAQGQQSPPIAKEPPYPWIGRQSDDPQKVNPSVIPTDQADSTTDAASTSVSSDVNISNGSVSYDQQPTKASQDEAPQLGALIPHRFSDAVVEHVDSHTTVNHLSERSDPVDQQTPNIADVLDLALLDRLLGAQEEKVAALAKAEQTEASLVALNERNEGALTELDVLRRENDVTADRLREERMARIIADAKVAELRERVLREMTLADGEKQARVEATMRNIRAERSAANAAASMGWVSRRRHRRLTRNEQLDD